MDTAFLSFLIDEGADTNEDGKIDNGEAQTITQLSYYHPGDLYPRYDYNITNLTGIEAFTNLEEFVVENCNLMNLDLSNNTNLITLALIECALTTLDVSNITALVKLNIEGMPTLEGVCVWTMPFPPDVVHVYTDGSPNVSFTTDFSN